MNNKKDNRTTFDSDQLAVKENSNMRLFESEEDLLEKAFFFIAILDSARNSPNRIRERYGIAKNPKLDKVSLTAEQLIKIFKKAELNLTPDQLNFILKDETNRMSFVTFIDRDRPNGPVLSISYHWE